MNAFSLGGQGLSRHFPRRGLPYDSLHTPQLSQQPGRHLHQLEPTRQTATFLQSSADTHLLKEINVSISNNSFGWIIKVTSQH